MKLKGWFKNLIFTILKLISCFLPKNRGVILLYHSVDCNDVYLTVKPEVFEKQMGYLKKNNFNVIGLGELVEILKNKKEILPKTVVLTFDDGFLSHYKNVYPVLAKYNFSATFFISTGKIGGEINNSENKPQPTAGWEEIKEMNKSALTDIEPHAVTHRELTELNEEDAKNEIINSKKEVEEKLNKKCHFFAPPRGAYNDKTLNLIKENGFVASVTIEEGLIGKNADPFRLKRNTIDSSCNSDIQFSARLGWPVVIFNALAKLWR